MQAANQEKLPAWDNSTEYKGLHSPEFDQDVVIVEKYLQEISILNKELEPLYLKKEFSDSERAKLIKGLQEIALKNEQAMTLHYNLATYIGCELSLNSKNEEARKFKSKAQEVRAALSTLLVPSQIFLTKCDESILAAYLKADHTCGSAYFWKHARTRQDYLLSDDEEKTLAQFAPYAANSWYDLYAQISGSLKVNLATQGEMGVAQAAGLLRGPDEKIRKEAWEALQLAWKTVEIPCAAVLNNLVGYREELYRKRSHAKKVHFLDTPLFESWIEPATLEAMMNAVQENISIPRRALRAMAKSLHKQKIDPWDLLAPSPRLSVGSSYPFAEGLAMVHDAFASVDPKMGEFVDTMAKNNWIEARIMANKSAGAHCTGFMKSKTPRVFQSYMGSMKDISTLAHELGHAYHSWVMRDLTFAEQDYPMTVAETASTFSETLLAEKLFAKATGDEKFTIAWEDASDAVTMLINIPARFDFEKSLYEARMNGPLSAKELSDLTDKAWQKWYGDDLSQPESQYWMTKMHFSFSGISFYNFPYTFGYLFSLGIYATREKLGAKFHQAYVDLLRDSGRMTVEELVQKHLGADIRKPAFWQASIGIIAQKVERFEKLV